MNALDRRLRWASVLIGVQVLVIVLTAASPRTPLSDVELRVLRLESLIHGGPGRMTQVQVPFEVVDGSGRPVLRVSAGEVTAGAVSIAKAPDGAGIVELRNGGGTVVAAMGAQPDATGLAYVADKNGKPRAGLTGAGGVSVRNVAGDEVASMFQSRGHGRFTVWEGGVAVAQLLGDSTSGDGTMWLREPKGTTLVGMGVSPEGTGVVYVSDKKGTRRVGLTGEGGVGINNEAGDQIASMFHTKGHGRFSVWEGDHVVALLAADSAKAGLVTVTDANGKAAVAMLGAQRGMAVVNAQGRTVAEVVAGPAGNGLFQVWSDGKVPLAVLGRPGDRDGGIVQLSNGKVVIASLSASPGGNGLFQLNEASGTPIVEAGMLGSGRGTVRVGPLFECKPISMNLRVPDCLVGRID